MVSNSAKARENMIYSQLETNEVNDSKILNALRQIPRENFVPLNYKKIAYLDEEIELGEGKFLTEPLIFARMLKVVELSGKDKVLDIASATGYSSAVISKLVGHVYSIDDSTKIVNMAKSNLTKLEINNVSCSKTDIVKGLLKEAPYNVIFIHGEVDEVPVQILEQLKEGGRLVTIKDGFIKIIKNSGSEFVETKTFQARTFKLKAFTKPKSFIF